MATNDLRAAFIEAEMARLRSGNDMSAHSTDHLSKSTKNEYQTLEPLPSHHRQPAVVGHLQEIDLGPSAALKNIALTEAATRRLQNGGEEEGQSVKKPEKVFIGRDGKPRVRKRYRRPSDAVKRDAIVEAVMRESRCMCSILSIFKRMS